MTRKSSARLTRTSGRLVRLSSWRDDIRANSGGRSHIAAAAAPTRRKLPDAPAIPPLTTMPASTEIYLRADPVEKLAILAAHAPPGVKPGKFRPPSDKLLAMLAAATSNT